MHTLARACMIALAGILIGGVVSALHPTLKLAPDPPAPTVIPLPPSGVESANGATGSASHTTAQTQEPQVIKGTDVTIAQAKAFFDAGTPFIDARRREEYELGHVTGAFLLPPEMFTSGKPEAVNYLAPDQPVIVYCGGGECDASKNVVILLQQLGFTRCFIMNDGYPAWVKAGHPTATGKPDYEAGGGS